MTLSPKQVTGAGVLVAVGLAFAFFARDAAPFVAGVAFLGAVVIFYAGSGATARSMGWSKPPGARRRATS
jgi:hypothetical protein